MLTSPHRYLSFGQECGAAGVELLSRALREQKDAFLDSLDLVFKWISLRLCEKENVKALGQVSYEAPCREPSQLAQRQGATLSLPI